MSPCRVQVEPAIGAVMRSASARREARKTDGVARLLVGIAGPHGDQVWAALLVLEGREDAPRLTQRTRLRAAVWVPSAALGQVALVVHAHGYISHRGCLSTFLVHIFPI